MDQRGRLYRVEAVVLGHRDLGEADRLLTLYTLEEGKVRVVAKGVRRPTSRKAGHVEPLVYGRLLLARGRSLDLVTQAEMVDAFLPLREDLRRLAYGMYVAELVDHFGQEGEANPALFRLLVEGLRALTTARDLTLVARWFELRVLELEGYRPELWRCVRCGGGVVEEDVGWSAGMGGVVCGGCVGEVEDVVELSVGELRLLRVLQEQPYEVCARMRLSAEERRGLERVMRRYLLAVLERRPRSLAFIEHLRRRWTDLAGVGDGVTLE